MERELQAAHGVQATQAAAAPDSVVAMLRSLADPTRLQLILAVRAKERCVSDLVASEGHRPAPGEPPPSMCCRAGLVQSRRSDGFTLYAVDPEGMAVARSAAMDLLDPGAIGPLGRAGDNTDCCR